MHITGQKDKTNTVICVIKHRPFRIHKQHCNDGMKKRGFPFTNKVCNITKTPNQEEK